MFYHQDYYFLIFDVDKGGGGDINNQRDHQC